MNNYLTNFYQRKERKENQELNIFGYGFGTFLILFGLYRYFINDINYYWDILYLSLFLNGLILTHLTIINPFWNKKIHYFFKKIIEILGSFVLNFLLAIIYFLIVTPISFFVKNKKKQFIKSSFETKIIDKVIDSQKHISFFLQIGKIFNLVFNHQNFIFIPLLIILVLLALLLFFVQTSVVAPFIYTLF